MIIHRNVGTFSIKPFEQRFEAFHPSLSHTFHVLVHAGPMNRCSMSWQLWGVIPFADVDDTGLHTKKAGHPTVVRVHRNDDLGVVGRNVHAHGGIAAIEVLQQE